MSYRIIRIDGKKDKITSNYFDNYDDAYNLLESIYGDACCSDSDDGNMIYYDISKINTLWKFISK